MYYKLIFWSLSSIYRRASQIYNGYTFGSLFFLLKTHFTFNCKTITLLHIVRATVLSIFHIVRQSSIPFWYQLISCIIARSKRDGTRVETRFGLSAKRTSPFKSAGVSVQPITGSRGVRISGQRLYRPCSDVQWKAAGYPFHSHISPSLPLPCVTVCHQVPNALYQPSCHTQSNLAIIFKFVTAKILLQLWPRVTVTRRHLPLI